MLISLLITLSYLTLTSSDSPPSLAKPGCQQKCGHAVISYPFGITAGCYHNQFFQITCNTTSNPPKPYLTALQLELLRIRLATQTVKVNMPMTFNCTSTPPPWTSLDLAGTPFTFSRRYNAFAPVNCTGIALSYYENRVLARCAPSVCENASEKNQVFSDDVFPYTYKGLCSAVHPPYGLTSYSVNISEVDGGCRYVGLAEADPATGYQFNLSGVVMSNDEAYTPVVLNWLYDLAIDPGSEFFRQGRCDLSSYLDTGIYSCSCPDGQVGNPYLANGCVEVEECASCDGNCIILEVDSNDVPVAYECLSNSRSWIKRHHWAIPVIIGLGAAIGSIILLLGCYWFYRLVNRWKETRRRAKNFKRNGGLLLQRQISSNEVAIKETKVFTSKELEAATDRFHKDRILGRGGQGTVFKGMLVDGRIIAVKKATNVDESQIESFINELAILTQINHRNVVKLLGCCLETDVPLLVYEYVPNGSLFEHIHDPTDDFPITWKMRLQIATDVAGAISYLHSASSIPIYHRDIKSSNILLDEKYKAKVSDFGASRTIPIDQTHLTTGVKGTFGYVDPEYFQSNQLTEKSDVYSFGVVLVELLTGQKPIRSPIYGDERGLIAYFLSSLESLRLSEIVDDRIVRECCEEEAMAFANLARRCLRLKGKERPAMKEVVTVLEGIKSGRLDQDLAYENSGEGVVLDEASEGGGSLSSTVSMDLGSSRVLGGQPLFINTF